MNKIIITGLLVICVSFSCYARKKEPYLLKIGGTEVTLSEFLQIYERNNKNIPDSIGKKTALEYLDLYINFKLKVLEAQKMGYDTTETFRNELTGYRQELAIPYLSDTAFINKMVRETYQRMRKEVNASHIMIAMPENTPTEDTIVFYQKICDIRKEIEGGLDFNEAAVKYSQDQSVEKNRGNLGWFSAFQMVYPFENTAYTTPENKISAPFRTRYGYHLIKVHGVRDAEGEIHVSHIMKMYPQDGIPEHKKNAQKSIDSIYALVLNGADFEQLARQLSDDKQSAEKGGELPWFTRGRMIPAFSNPAFDLRGTGDVSRPIDSGFGFHIIKKLGIKPVPEFSEVNRELKERVMHDRERSKVGNEIFLNNLKKEYNFRKNEAAVKELLDSTSVWLQKDKPQIPDTFKNNPVLFSFKDTTYQAIHWIRHLRDQKNPEVLNISPGISELYRKWEDEAILAFENVKLEEKYPEFRALVQEYHDGMLLFSISDSNIWQKAARDTAGLAIFYEANKNKYMGSERFKGMIIQCVSPQIKEEFEKYLDLGIPVNEIYDLARISEAGVTITEGSWSSGEHPVIDYYLWKGPRPQEWMDILGFVRGEITEPGPKSLKESRGYHIADYQQYIEENWIQELRKKYPVVINKKVMKKLENAGF